MSKQRKQDGLSILARTARFCGFATGIEAEDTAESPPTTRIGRKPTAQVDLQNAVVWIPDSKTPNGTAEVPLSPLAIEAFRRQMVIAGESPFLFPSDLNRSGHQTTFKTVWHKTLRRAKVPYFRIYDLRSTYARG